jgi:hypothetical protein
MRKITVLPQSQGWSTDSLEQFAQVWTKPGNGHFAKFDDGGRTLFLVQLSPDGKLVIRDMMVQQVNKRADGSIWGVTYAIEEAIEDFFGRPVMIVEPTLFQEMN